MTWAQDQRIAWIKGRIEAGENVTRAMVRDQFCCTVQTVTATFHKLKERHPGLMAYDEKVKAYRRADLAANASLPWKERALAAEAKLGEYERLFELQRAAEMRGIKLWQAAGGRDLTWPDRGNFVVWLLEQLQSQAPTPPASDQPGSLDEVNGRLA